MMIGAWRIEWPILALIITVYVIWIIAGLFIWPVVPVVVLILMMFAALVLRHKEPVVHPVWNLEGKTK